MLNFSSCFVSFFCTLQIPTEHRTIYRSQSMGISYRVKRYNLNLFFSRFLNCSTCFAFFSTKFNFLYCVLRTSKTGSLITIPFGSPGTVHVYMYATGTVPRVQSTTHFNMGVLQNSLTGKSSNDARRRGKGSKTSGIWACARLVEAIMHRTCDWLLYNVT